MLVMGPIQVRNSIRARIMLHLLHTGQVAYFANVASRKVRFTPQSDSWTN